jgi:hypothetical protein
MDSVDQRRHPRGIVAVAAVVSPQRAGPVTGVIDLSEGGACLEWSLVGDFPPGTPVRLCFLLDNDHTFEVDGTIARIFNGRAGIEFAPAQRDLVRQLMAEVKSED